MKNMKLLQALEDLLAEPGCFSVLFPSFTFHWNHRVNVVGGGGKWRKRNKKEGKKEREKGRQR